MISNPGTTANRGGELPAIKAVIQASFLDWRGMISSVVFLGACNFRCPYCHNSDLVLCPERLVTFPLDEVRDYLNTYENWLDGVVISGGEPCINSGLPALIAELRALGLKIKLDTNGSRPEVLEQLIQDGMLDYVAMDFKAPLNEFSYRRCTGVWTDVTAIGRSIDLLRAGAIDYEFRVTICPGLLDTNDLLSMGERIQGARRFTLQGFAPHNTLDSSFAGRVPYSNEKLDQMRHAVAPYVEECLLVPSP
ncbi:MAG: anaerobic ribonucleoside-triphosphate reductase activating protein [bacterium]